MTEIYKDSESIDTSSFQEEIVLENYFAGANRAEVLSRMKEAVQSGVALMVLTGDEGSGKTMMCRMLEHELPSSCITVFFPHTVDSFEDVVKSVASQLGLDAAGMEGAWHVEDILQQIAEFLKSVSRDLLVIFDEAENIYLATLERNRKMLDLINGHGARMHVLFSGHNTLIENCNQLSICDFQNTDELHFELSPLSEDETIQYLKMYGPRLADAGGDKILSDIIAQNIYGIAKGNFRMTNFLAEGAISVNGDEESFKVFLDSIRGEAGTGIKEEHGDKLGLIDLLKHYSDYLPWVGGALCCLLLLVFLFRPGDEQSEVSPKIQQSGDVEKVVSGSTERIQQPEPKVLPDIQTDKVALPDTSATEQPPSQREIVKKELEVTQPVETIAKPPSVQGEVAKLGASEEESQQVNTEKETDKTVPEIKVVENMQPFKERVIVELRPTGLLKRKPAFAPQEVRRRTIKLQSPRTEMKDVTVANEHLPAEQLLRKRFSAGKLWKSGGKDNMYTVQLMVLASKVAENNLLKMLVQDNYRQEAGNFYIFKKTTAPENIFVFYGEYPNISMARLAQDSLPRFLRDHKPYVISIKGALAKVQ